MPRSKVKVRDLEGRVSSYYKARYSREEIIRLLLAEEDIEFHAGDDCGATVLSLPLYIRGLGSLTGRSKI
jgi:hypothetical protein